MELAAVLKSSISVGAFFVIQMPLDSMAVASELHKSDRPVGDFGKPCLLKIYVYSLDVTLALLKPARRCTDEARAVRGLYKLTKLVSIKLPPALVEDGPKADRRVIVKPVNNGLAVKNEDLLCLFTSDRKSVV